MCYSLQRFGWTCGSISRETGATFTADRVSSDLMNMMTSVTHCSDSCSSGQTTVRARTSFVLQLQKATETCSAQWWITTFLMPECSRINNSSSHIPELPTRPPSVCVVIMKMKTGHSGGLRLNSWVSLAHSDPHSYQLWWDFNPLLECENTGKFSSEPLVWLQVDCRCFSQE